MWRYLNVLDPNVNLSTESMIPSDFEYIRIKSSFSYIVYQTNIPSDFNSNFVCDSSIVFVNA